MFEKVTGCELRAVLQGTDPEDDRPTVIRANGEPADVGQPGGVDRDHEASLGLTGRLAEGRHDGEADGDDSDRNTDPYDGAASADHAPMPVLPGACSGIPSRQRGQVAGPGS